MTPVIIKFWVAMAAITLVFVLGCIGIYRANRDFEKAQDDWWSRNPRSVTFRREDRCEYGYRMADGTWGVDMLPRERSTHKRKVTTGEWETVDGKENA